MKGRVLSPNRTALMATTGVLLLLVLPMGHSPRAFGIHAIGMIMILLAMAQVLRRIREERTHRVAWLAVGAVILITFINRTSMLVRLVRRGPALVHHPIPEVLGIYGVVLLIVFAMIRFRPERTSLQETWLRSLDGAVFSLAAFLLLWMGVGKPVLEGPTLLPFSTLALLQGLFAFTAAGLGVGLHVILRQRSFAGPAGALALAILAIALVMPWALRANMTGQYRMDHPALALGLCSLHLIYLAVHAPLPTGRAERTSRSLNLLPYAPAALAFLAFLADALAGGSRGDRLALALVSVLALVVLVRQGLTLLQMRELNRTLERRVQVRSRELAEKESLVMRTQGMNLIASIGAGMAHDLNNLMGGAMLQAELLKGEAEAPSTVPEADLALLQKTLLRAGELTARLMAVGRRERVGGMVDLGAHLRGMAAMLRALVPRNHELELAFPEGTFPVACDPSQLDQLVVNLVVNARDALAEPGRIRVGLTRADEAPFAEIAVEDDGCGIAPEVLSRIFEPFFTTKAPGKGTGLGLGSVKAVVEGLGGSLQVRTVPGRGSCFTLRLPLAA